MGPERAFDVFFLFISIRTRIYRILRFCRIGFRNPSTAVHLRKFLDQKQHVFFGYYDISPINNSNSLLLAMQVPFIHHSPKANDIAKVGYYKLSDRDSKFVSIGQTNTWCWQQGCRLQWYPLKQLGRNDLILYNRIFDGNYGSCVQNVITGRIVKQLLHPVYAMTPDGKYAFSLNFSRLGRMRPGYGYTIIPDETKGLDVPDNDGIFRIDMNTGASQLLFSIAQIKQFESLPTMAKAEHYFNHICSNPTGTRLLFFHVWKKQGMRFTRFLTCNIDGSDLYAFNIEKQVSHYTWKSKDEIICVLNQAGKESSYIVFTDKCDKEKRMGEGVLRSDGHPSFLSDHNLLLTDTYPDKFGDRNLLLYNDKKNTLKHLGAFYSPSRYNGETRCDLHPRWNPSNNYIVFDSTHEGRRGIYLLQVNAGLFK